MSAAVKAALAARRAANRSPSSSPTKPSAAGPPAKQSEDGSPFISPFGSPKPRGRTLNKSSSMESASTEGQHDPVQIQRPIQDIVRASIDNGRANLASRSPALTEVPHQLLSLLSDAPPAWFQEIPDDERGPWYAREELRTLQLANNEIQEVSPRISEFPMLSRLELQNNRIAAIPTPLLRLTALTTVNLARNGLTAVPTCLLATDTLISLNLSHNKIQTLWDDKTVLEVRGEREGWDQDQARERDDGVWSGLSGNKQPDLGKARAGPKQVPMHGLKTLDLSSNKLDNAALGIPDLARRKNVAASNAVRAPVRLPQSLKKLDLGHNQLRGPISVAVFVGLNLLEDLSLRGSGIGDDVFKTQGDEVASGSQVFSALANLDLGMCELDDLKRLEELFGSKRTKTAEAALRPDSVSEQSDSTGQRPAAAAGMTERQLVKVTTRLTQVDIEKMAKSNGAVLCLVLDGNPLREEALRQKRGVRASASPAKRAHVAAPLNDAAALLAQDPAIAATSRISSSAMRSTPGTASRREGEAVEGVDAPEQESSAGAGENILHQFLRGRTWPDGRAAHSINKTGLSDWDGEASPVRPSRGSKDRGTSQQRSNSDEAADKDPGSAMATAKLSTKKKEALGQVPCKFFRSNGCSAGNSCPFAHTLPGDGQQKATCQWFLKGSCRFGHKCALAHVLPGQPMSMDRKNKRAAQHGQPLPQAPAQAAQTSAGGGSQQGSSTPQHNGLIPSQLLASRQQLQDQQQQMPSPSFLQQQHQTQQQQQPPMLSEQARHPTNSFSGRDHEMPFGVPDDLQALSPPPNGPSRSLLDALNGSSQVESPRDPIAAAQHRSNLLGELSNAGSFGSAQRPLAVPRAAGPSSFGAVNSGHAGMSIDGHVLGSPPAARALGTSPFSHPGGHGLFFSGSQDSEGGAGPFACNGRDVMFGVRSMGRMDNGAAAKGKWWSSLGETGPKEEDDDDDETEDAGAEDFLPSSLSDLLTPAELERRRRNAQMSTSFSGQEGRIMPQSLPTQAGATLGSSFTDPTSSCGRRPIGAERGPREQSAKTSNISTGFLQRRQGDPSDDPQSYRPLGERRFSSGLDGIALVDEGASMASSPGRAALHAPGQSLPQGLAAGLSRLHLTAGRGSGSAGGSGNSLVSAGATPGSASHQAHAGSQRTLGAGLNDYELGPTAPSSVLPHRSPLGMAIGSGNGRMSGAYGSPGTIGSGAHFSPSSFGGSAQRRTFGGEPMSLESETSKQPGGASVAIGAAGGAAGRPHQHPSMQRLRPPSFNVTPHSPLTLPEFTHPEVDEEEAIFELE